MRKAKSILALFACSLVFSIYASGQSQSDQAIADAVIAMTKAQWAAEMKDPANVDEQMKTIADDYSEFNPDSATRVDGKSLNKRIYEAGASSGARTVAAEMLNPRVQVYNGNVAVLSYNFYGMSRDKDGKLETIRAKSTRIYVKRGDTWQLVHANFAADPLPR